MTSRVESDPRNLTIGVLTTTAVILLVGFLLVPSQAPTAYADGATIVKDDYVLSVGGLTQANEDLLYIIDSPKQMLNVYRFNSNRNQIDLASSVSLEEMRKSASTPTGQGQPPPKPQPPKKKP